MGHAIYTLSDPRAKVLKSMAKKLAESKDLVDDFLLCDYIERRTPELYAEVTWRRKADAGQRGPVFGLRIRCAGTFLLPSPRRCSLRLGCPAGALTGSRSSIAGGKADASGLQLGAAARGRMHRSARTGHPPTPMPMQK